MIEQRAHQAEPLHPIGRMPEAYCTVWTCNKRGADFGSLVGMPVTGDSDLMHRLVFGPLDPHHRG